MIILLLRHPLRHRQVAKLRSLAILKRGLRKVISPSDDALSPDF